MKFYSFVHKCVSGIFRKVYCRVTIVGAENVPADGGIVICANHISNLDPFIIGACFKRQVRYMAKSELFKIPLVGSVVKAFGAFSVDRKSSDVGAIKTGIQLVVGGELLGIFPQGTRYPKTDPRETKIRHGVGMIALKTKSNILPVAISTKKRKISPFCQVTLIIGEPICYDSLSVTAENLDEYKRVTQVAFDIVCNMLEE